MTESFIRCRKLNISLVLSLNLVSVPNDVRLNSTHYLIMNINNKRELQSIAINHSANLDYKDLYDLQRIYKKIVFFFGY